MREAGGDGEGVERLRLADLDRIENFICAHEGVRTDVYRDSLGYWTIGCGHLVTRDKTATREQAAALCGAPWTLERCYADLREGVASRKQALDKRWPWWRDLSPARQAVMVSMAYQLGMDGLAQFRTFLGHAERGEHEDAALALLASKAAHQTPRRWQEQARMWKAG